MKNRKDYKLDYQIILSLIGLIIKYSFKYEILMNKGKLIKYNFANHPTYKIIHFFINRFDLETKI